MVSTRKILSCISSATITVLAFALPVLTGPAQGPEGERRRGITSCRPCFTSGTVTGPSCVLHNVQKLRLLGENGVGGDLGDFCDMGDLASCHYSASIPAVSDQVLGFALRNKDWDRGASGGQRKLYRFTFHGPNNQVDVQVFFLYHYDACNVVIQKPLLNGGVLRVNVEVGDE